MLGASLGFVMGAWCLIDTSSVELGFLRHHTLNCCELRKRSFKTRAHSQTEFGNEKTLDGKIVSERVARHISDRQAERLPYNFVARVPSRSGLPQPLEVAIVGSDTVFKNQLSNQFN